MFFFFFNVYSFKGEQLVLDRHDIEDIKYVPTLKSIHSSLIHFNNNIILCQAITNGKEKQKNIFRHVRTYVYTE